MVSKPIVWLRPNRRVVMAALIPLAGTTLVGISLASGLGDSGTAVRGLGVALAVVGLPGLLFAFWQFATPRLACADGHLLVYLRAGAPLRVPLEAVECFLLGQGPTLFSESLPRPSRTTTLVVRLSEKYEDWAHQDVQRLLGSWCGSQITIRGTWCEPLSVPLVNTLNEQLAQAQQQQSTARVSR